MPNQSFKIAGGSNPGLARENNEDRFYYDERRGIFIVVDGVGGQAAGEKASEIAVEKLRARLERATGTVVERIREAITIANNAIYEQARQNSEWSGMACVLTVAIVEGARVTVGHVGDTRLYKLQPGCIRKITHDHSPIGMREERGALSEIEAMRHPRRNEIFRDVGSAPHAPEDEDFIEIIEEDLEPDGALLLCSDGLSDLVASAQIHRLIEENADDPNLAVERLIEAANEAGGKDNITVILVENELFAAGVRKRDQNGIQKNPAPAIVDANRVDVERAPLLREFLKSRVTAFALGTLFGVVLLSLWQFLLWPRVIKAEAAPPAPRALTVGKDHRADFLTINAALEQARPGDTVIVEPGEYAEQVRLKEGVTLESRITHQAVIRAPEKPDARSTAVIATGITRGRFIGFKIFGDEERRLTTGLHLRDTHIEVADLDVSGVDEAGVKISGESAARITASNIHDNHGAGVVIEDAARPLLKSDLIIRNGRIEGSEKPGVEVHQKARPHLVENLIADNGAEAIWTFGELDAEGMKQNLFGGKLTANSKGQVKITGSAKQRDFPRPGN